MSPGNKYQPYTTADILRYLSGEMEAKEMRRLELAALDDPFLQDAIDGYKLEWEKGDRKKLAQYANEALAMPGHEEKEPARVVPFFRKPIFKYAVAAALIAGTGWFLYTFNNPSIAPKPGQESAIVTTTVTDSVPADDVALMVQPEKQTRALPDVSELQKKQESRLVDSPPALASANYTPAAGAISPVEPPPLKGLKTDNEDIAAAGKPVSPVDASSISKRSVYSKDTGTVKGIERSGPPTLAFSKIEKNLPVSESAPTTNFASPYLEMKQKSNRRYSFSGQTVDREKYPLENITLRVKGDTVATVSDELGRFQLNLPDSQVTLVASGVGVETREFVAKAKKEKMEVELQQSKSQALQEVVVSGYTAKRSKTTPVMDIDTADASPKGGWQNFTRYIENNKQVKAGKQPVYVVLVFEIDENGRPAAVDIIDSGGKAYDKEALRLLKAGPSWINKTKDKVTFAKITVVL